MTSIRALACLGAALLGCPTFLHAQPPARQVVTQDQLDDLGRQLREKLDQVRSNEGEIARLRAEERTLLTDDAAQRQITENQAALYRDVIDVAPEAWKASTGGSTVDVMTAGEKVRQLGIDALSVNDPAFDLLDADARRREINKLISDLQRKNAQLYAEVLQALVGALIAAASTENAVKTMGSKVQAIEFKLVAIGERAGRVATDRAAARVAAAREKERQARESREGRGHEPREREPRHTREPKEREPKERGPKERSPKDREPKDRGPEMRLP